jgi:hypothetical protein
MKTKAVTNQVLSFVSALFCLVVFVCTALPDDKGELRAFCVMSEDGLKYEFPAGPKIGFTLPFTPDNCAINTGKKGDRVWKEFECGTDPVK